MITFLIDREIDKGIKTAVETLHLLAIVLAGYLRLGGGLSLLQMCRENCATVRLGGARLRATTGSGHSKDILFHCEKDRANVSPGH